MSPVSPSVQQKTPDFLRMLLFLIATGLLVFPLACGGDDDTPTPDASPTAGAVATNTPAPEPTATTDAGETPTVAVETPTAAPSATATSEPQSSLDALSLVYVDTRRGQGGDIYVADADGANPQLVVSEGAFRRPLDVTGGTLASVGEGGVLLTNLASGETQLLEEPRIVFDGRFFDAETFFYSASGSCTQGGGALYRVELPDYEVMELITSDLSLTITGQNVATSALALLPRGCDVGVSQLDIYDALTGELRNTLAVEGCGWAVAIPDQNKAVTSWQACTPPANHADAHATVYDFGIVGPTGHDVTVPAGRPSASMWLPRPGHAEVALGLTVVEGAGPGSERGGGIWTLDLTNREFTQLVEGQGAEQYPVAWSPDGRYLLYAIVAAQGLCSFSYVDLEAADPQPIALSEQITFCGINGHVVGWTRLP